VVQSVVARFAGSINQILVDDKGLTVVVAFGVVRRAHEDDATRAVRSSLAVRDELSPFRADVRLGVATGRVFTGTRGGASRHEFAILGSSVVLAARLASVAEDILCDAATRAASRKVIRFGPSRQFDLKGKAEAVDAWRPLAIKADLQRVGIVGRRDELAVLERRLSELARDGKGGAVIIEGEPGIGKTALINELLKWAQSRAMRSLAGAGDSIELRTTYLAWRSVAAGLVGSDAMAEPEVLRRRLIDLLGPENARWIPLLHSVFAVPQLGDDDTLSMSAESRAQTTRELLVKLLEGAARSTPLLIVLEDAHWMDSASWELAEQAVNRIPRLLLLASVRPLVERIQPLEHLKRRSDAMTIHLGALNHEEIRELVCRRLEAEAIPDQLATLVNRRAEGHPLYAQELSLALRDSGAIVVRDGTCRLMAEVSGGGDTSLPDTVQGIVATRIDQLTPQQQLTLKVAAVLGRQFSLTDLAAVHPVSKDRTVVEQQALGIAQAGLLHRLHQRADLFAFAHALVQEVAYESMPYSQRRELHQQAAAWLERVPGRTLDELLPVLAYHWERSEVADKAIYYLEKAGERALERDSSNREAEDFLTRLIALATAMPRWPVPGTDAETAGGARRVALARWERMLSQALGRQGRHAPAMTHLERSIRLLGHTVPSATFTCRLEYGGGVVLRLLWRPSRKPPRRRSATEHLRLLELTRAYESFVQLLYLGSPASSSGTRRTLDVPLLSGVAVLRSLRAAERAGPSAELSRSYSIFSNVVAMFRRAKLSSFYSGRGRAIAEATSDKHALFCALTIGQLPSFIRGDWEQVTSALHQALVLGGVLRNVHDCLINEGVLAYVSFNQGHLEEALTRFRDIGVRARQHDHLVPQLWALASIGEVAFRQGRWDDAIASADACLELADRMETIDQNSRFQAHGLLISAWIRKQRLERAWPHVDRAIDAAEAGARLSYTPQFGFIGVAEALLTVWDRGGDDASSAAARLRRWLRTLRLMAFCRPILQPWDLVFRASWNCRRGRRRLATRQLRKAIRLADAMGLAYESALARADLARLLARNDPRRNLILEQACATFTAIGATAQLHETQALRSTTPS
jgi:tetratricopeptide (TPR) repeat protein